MASKRPKQDLNYRVNLDWGPLTIWMPGDKEPRHTMPGDDLGEPVRQASGVAPQAPPTMPKRSKLPEVAEAPSLATLPQRPDRPKRADAPKPAKGPKRTPEGLGAPRVRSKPAAR